jgi:hypothetical protein
MLAADPISTGDSAKLLLLLVVAGVFVLLARRSSHPAARVSPEEPDAGLKKLLPAEEPAPQGWGPSAEEVARSFPADPLLGKIQIRKFFFKKLDAIPGPTDPDAFADELNVELYDPDTGYRWWQCWFVATPKGLAQILKDKNWKYLHAPETLVLPRYDLEEIRRAVVSRIAAEGEHFKGKQQLEEELL